MWIRHVKIIFALVCVCACILVGVGVKQFLRQSQEVVRLNTASREAQVNELLEDVQDLSEKTNLTYDATCRQALAWRVHPAGVFVWLPRKGVPFQIGLSSEFVAQLEARKFYHHWTNELRDKRKPPHRGSLTLSDAREKLALYWARPKQGEGPLVGLVFTEDPFSSPLHLEKYVLSIFMMFFPCLVVVLGWILLRQVQKDRRENELKTDFVSNVSHELRTPLASSKMWLELFARGVLTTKEKQAKGLSILQRENEHLLRLVENLLDFSRLERKRRTLHLTQVDLYEIVSHVADVVRTKFPNESLKIPPAGVWICWADGDAVEQILTNVLDNAAKYALASGPVEILVQAIDHTIRVDVCDRGPGLTAEARVQVFERFYRTDRALSSKTSGLGLGLSIARALAREMAGDLTLLPRTGGGLIARLTLKKAICDGGA